MFSPVLRMKRVALWICNLHVVPKNPWLMPCKYNCKQTADSNVNKCKSKECYCKIVLFFNFHSFCISKWCNILLLSKGIFFSMWEFKKEKNACHSYFTIANCIVFHITPLLSQKMIKKQYPWIVSLGSIKEIQALA